MFAFVCGLYCWLSWWFPLVCLLCFSGFVDCVGYLLTLVVLC